MADESTPRVLDALRASLEELNSHTLPAKTIQVMRRALEELDQLEAQLAVNRQQRRFATLYGVTQMLGGSLHLEEVLNQVMDAVIALTGADRGFLMLYDPEKDRLDLQAARNFERENLEKDSMKVSRTVIRSVLESGRPVLTDNAQSDPRFADQDSVIMYALRAILSVPLQIRGKTTGVIYVDNPLQINQFDDEQLELVNALATQAAVVIENARLYQAVQEANLAKSGFVSIVSHELRVPMTSIQGYTDLMLQGIVGEVSQQQREFLEIIRSNVDRMRVLVSDLSDLSRIETGRLRLDIERIALPEFVEQIQSDFRPRLAEKRQTLTVELPHSLPEIQADRNRVMQILTNLVSNAWKYTPAGGSLFLRVRQEGDQVRVEVEDDGYGISREDQGRLFTQFFRSENPKIREQTGWGLGLNVTKNLVELMGGAIGVTSVLDAGSTFWFTLPLAA